MQVYFENNMLTVFPGEERINPVLFAFDPSDETHALLLEDFVNEDKLIRFSELIVQNPNTGFLQYLEERDSQ